MRTECSTTMKYPTLEEEVATLTAQTRRELAVLERERLKIQRRHETALRLIVARYRQVAA